MKHHLGLFLQFIVLATLPVLVVWQLLFHIPLVVMPASLVIGLIVFTLGTQLRES